MTRTIRLRKKRQSVVTLLCLAILSAIFALQVHAQGAASSSLIGKVLDPSGCAIVGAHVMAIADARNTVQTTTSDEAGQFTLALEPGKYAVRISAKDFLEASQTITIGDAP